MSLRVALVGLYPAPGGKAPGGVRAVMHSLTGGLQAYEDLQVHVVHCHSDVQQGAILRTGKATVHYLSLPRQRLVPNTLASIVRVQRELCRLVPDVVNTHAAHYTIAALRAGFPTAYTIHGVVHREAEVYQGTWRDRVRFLLETWCDRYAVARVRHIVAISPYVLKEYRGRSRATFHRIENPLDSRWFDLENEEQPGQLLYAGTIDERKNVLGLLRAFDLVRRRMPAARLRIAGRTTNAAYNRKVQDYVRCAGLDSNVEFLGLQDGASMLREYARCAAVLLASVQETAPMTVIEAMAAGKPVVANQVGGLADLVEDGRSGFLIGPDDTASFANRVVELLSDASLRQRMGLRARQLAQRFRVQHVAAQYRQLYYELAGKAAP